MQQEHSLTEYVNAKQPFLACDEKRETRRLVTTGKLSSGKQREKGFG